MKIIENFKKENKYLYYGFLMLGVATVLSYFFHQPSTNKEIQKVNNEPEKSLDTYIPIGKNLLPIEIANAEYLDPLIGPDGGVVDLYQVANESNRGVKIASRIKIVRSPNSTLSFSAYITDEQTQQIMNFPGPFRAVVQNPNAAGSEVKQIQNTVKPQQKIQIEYGD